MPKIKSKFGIMVVILICQIIGLAQIKSVAVPMKCRDGMPAIEVRVNRV